MEDNDLPINDAATKGADAVERYLGGETANADAAVFARCDAVIALTPKLAASPDVGWAFDEARELARSDPRGRNGSTALPGPSWRWLQHPGIAWGAAGVLAVALVVAVQLREAPESATGEPVSGGGGQTLSATQAAPTAQATQAAQTAQQPTIQNFTYAPIVVSTELAQALAEVRPVVLLADRTPVDSRSLAVMPFTASANAGIQSRGMLSADSIYTQVYRQLAAIPGLYLIDPSITAVYAGSELTAAEIAQQLGVRGILEGNIDSINGDIHFSLNFTDAATAGSSINQSIERPAAEVAYLQSDIASSVLDALARTSPADPLEPIL